MDEHLTPDDYFELEKRGVNLLHTGHQVSLVTTGA